MEKLEIKKSFLSNAIKCHEEETKCTHTFNVRDGSYVIFGRQHEFIVDNPIRFVVETCRWMQLHHLIIFDR